MHLINQTEHTVYLIKQVEGDPTDLERVLRPYYKQIFAEQLAGWHLVEDDWPKRRGLKTFLRWFDVEVNTMVLDLARGGIFREPLPAAHSRGALHCRARGDGRCCG